MSKSIVRDKSKKFAIRIVRLYKYLTQEKTSLLSLNNFYALEQVLVLISQNKNSLSLKLIA